MLGRFQLKKDLRRKNSAHVTVGFSEARRIGILYDATREEDFETVKEYIKKLRTDYKKDMLAMGFVNKNKLPKEQFPQYGLDFFTRKELNFKMVPIDPIVHNFINERFDILIDLHASGIFPLQYIAAMSNARFRVGRYDKRNVNSYDMMINIRGLGGIKQMIEETEHFLRKLDKQ